MSVRTAFLAVAVSGVFAAFVQAQEHQTIEISHNSYAAIAYSPATGKYAYATDYRSRKAAEKAALEKCGADDATIACWVNHGFCALALGNDKSCWGVGWEYGDGANNQRAKSKAMEDCGNRTTGVHIAVMLSSDGQYIWDYKDHVTIVDAKGNVYHGDQLVTPTPKPSPAARSQGSLFQALEGATPQEEKKK